MGGNLAIAGLLAAANLTVFYDEADQTQATPFCIVRLDGVLPNDDKDAVSHFDFDTVLVLCFGGSAKESYDLAVSARTALDRISGTSNGVVVESIQFQDMKSESEFIDNKRTFVNIQQYQVMTRP